ncbi:MAG: hypothetical protein NT090_15610 [Acidobacteria bacterium]|nr:hypothetical protein [Acidobacteriota bacterium]
MAVEAIRGQKTLNQLAGQFLVHPVQIAHWRKTAIKQLDDLFVDGRKKKALDAGADRGALYAQSGRLKVELDWPKKSWHARLTSGGFWPIRRWRRSASGVNASCWASAGRASVMCRRGRATRICC